MVANREGSFGPVGSASMKLLLVTPEFPPDHGGGIITFYGNLVPALRGLGCCVSVLKGSAYIHGEAAYEHDGTQVTVLERERFQNWLQRFDHFAMFPELQRHLAAAFALHEQAKAGEGFDAVEVTDWGLLFLPWVIDSKPRVLVQLHGSAGQIAHREPVAGHEAEGVFTLLLERTALATASSLATYSRSNVDWWESILERPVHYSPPPLQLEEMKTRNVASGDPWLTVGRIQDWKGPHVACAAWRILGAVLVGLEWVGRDVIQGRTGLSTDSSLQRQFPDVWRKTIHPVGQLPPGEVKQKMSAARAVLVPSTWDVFNLVTAEAMTLGKVVVVSDGAGAADLIENDVNGFTFENGNAAALAELVQLVEKLRRTRCVVSGSAPR